MSLVHLPLLFDQFLDVDQKLLGILSPSSLSILCLEWILNSTDNIGHDSLLVEPGVPSLILLDIFNLLLLEQFELLLEHFPR